MTFKEYCDPKNLGVHHDIFSVDITWNDAVSVTNVPYGRIVIIQYENLNYTYFVETHAMGMWVMDADGNPVRRSVFRFIDNFNPRR